MGKQWKQCQTFIFLGSKIIEDGDCSHEIKRRLLLGRKVMTNLDSILKSRDITLPTEVRLVKAMVFPVVMYGYKSWTVKKVLQPGRDIHKPLALMNFRKMGNAWWLKDIGAGAESDVHTQKLQQRQKPSSLLVVPPECSQPGDQGSGSWRGSAQRSRAIFVSKWLYKLTPLL